MFFNLRDFQHAWPSDPEKVLEIVAALACLPFESRPQGIMFEDQNGSWVPAVMEDAVHQVLVVRHTAESSGEYRRVAGTEY